MKELTVTAAIDKLDEVLSFVDTSLEETECPLKTQMQIDIAVEEMFVNIAHYAYTPGVGDATIRTEIQETPRALAVTFIDSGMPYDPLTKADPDVTLSAKDRKIGGLGIYMVKKAWIPWNMSTKTVRTYSRFARSSDTAAVKQGSPIAPYVRASHTALHEYRYYCNNLR